MLQFIWWGFHLVQLTELTNGNEEIIQKRVVMIIGEGSVFLIILIIGLLKIRSSIRKELQVNKNQTNFLLSVTHELKTPIASTKLYLQTVLKRDLDAEKRNSLIQKALSENDRLERMIDNIINASRLENRKLELHKKELDLTDFIDGIITRYQKLNPLLKIRLEAHANIIFSADPFVLETILNNLTENAIKYAGVENEILIRIKQKEKLHIEVLDCGPGIKPADQTAIFTKFYRAGDEETRSQKGSGLGLFIASEFAHMHNGNLKYRDNSPQGSIFELTL